MKEKKSNLRKLFEKEANIAPQGTTIYHLLSETNKEFISRSARYIAQQIENDQREKGTCFLGLSWSHDYYYKIYKRVIKYENINWEKVWIFLVHDTYVYQESVHSEQNKFVEMFYKRTNIPKKNLIFPDNSLLPSQ